jgi:hypothetical protein
MTGNLSTRLRRLEAKRGRTPLSALSDAELDARILALRATLAAEAERIAALPEHLRPAMMPGEEALDLRIRALEHKLEADGGAPWQTH